MRSPETFRAAVLVSFVLASAFGSAIAADSVEGETQRRSLAEPNDPRCQDCQPSQRPQCIVFYSKCDNATAANSTAPPALLNGYFAPTCDSAFCSGPGTSQRSTPTRLQPGDICDSCAVQGYQREEQCIEEYTNCVAANLPGNVSSCIDQAQTFTAYLCGAPQNLAPGPLPEKIQPLPNVRDLPAASPPPSPAVLPKYNKLAKQAYDAGELTGPRPETVLSNNPGIAGGAPTPLSHVSLLLSALEDDLFNSSDLAPIAAEPVPATLPLPLSPTGRRLLVAESGSQEEAMSPLPEDSEAPDPAPSLKDVPLADESMLRKLPVSIHGDEVQKLLPDVSKYGNSLQPPATFNGVSASPGGRRLLRAASGDTPAPGPWVQTTTAGVQAPGNIPLICQSCPSQFLLGNCAEFFIYCVGQKMSPATCESTTLQRFSGSCRPDAPQQVLPPPPPPSMPNLLPAAASDIPEVCTRCSQSFQTQCILFYQGCLSPSGSNQVGCQAETTRTYNIKCPGSR